MLTAVRPGGQLGPQPAARRFRPSPSETQPSQTAPRQRSNRIGRCSGLATIG